MRDPSHCASRITVLLLGSDVREHDPRNYCTDTMMVISVDRAHRSALMLSLPRDIYIRLPAVDEPGRINTAFRIGQETGYPGGGGMLAMKTVEGLIGVPVDHYLLVDFAAFRAVMEAVGPVTVCPKQEIHDDRYPDEHHGFMTVHFPPGRQELGAVALLQYARVRHNAGYDFGRTQRQQEIIRSVRARVLSPRGLWRLATGCRRPWRAVSAHIRTSMSLRQMLEIAEIAVQIPAQHIYSGVPTIRSGQLRGEVTSEGWQVLVPVEGVFQEFVRVLFDATPATAVTEIEKIEKSRGQAYRAKQRVLTWLMRAWLASARMGVTLGRRNGDAFCMSRLDVHGSRIRGRASV